MLLPPACNAAVEQVEQQRDGKERARDQQVTAAAVGDEAQRREAGLDARRGIPQGEPVRRMEGAEHREVTRLAGHVVECL